MGIILGSYTPDQGKLQCSTSKKRFISGCRDILSGIPVNTEEQIFGPKEDDNVDVFLPATIESRGFPTRTSQTYQLLMTNLDDSTCTMKILTANRHGVPDTTSWYNVWQAANAVYYRCVNAGFRGTFRGLGRL